LTCFTKNWLFYQTSSPILFFSKLCTTIVYMYHQTICKYYVLLAKNKIQIHSKHTIPLAICHEKETRFSIKLSILSCCSFSSLEDVDSDASLFKGETLAYVWNKLLKIKHWNITLKIICKLLYKYCKWIHFFTSH